MPGFKLKDRGALGLIWDALSAMSHDGSRCIMVVGGSMRLPKAKVWIVVDEMPMRAAMYDYAGRILVLSIIVASRRQHYFILHYAGWWSGRCRNLSADMTAFRRAPEDAGTERPPTQRNDEIGVVDAVDARLRRKGYAQKQHDEEVSDRAHGAQDQLQALAEDRAAAGGDGAGAAEDYWASALKVQVQLQVRHLLTADDRLPIVEEPGVDAVSFRKPLTFTSCDLSVLPNAVVCCAIVAPPRNTMPDSMPAATRQTIVSRSACGSCTTRPSKLLMALRATPSSTPANIRNSVAANAQVSASRAANVTTPMPPTDIAHARSLRA